MLRADPWAGGADLASGSLELGVGTFAYATLAGSPAVADLSVLGQAGGCIQRAVAGAARVVVVAHAHATLATAMA